MDYEVDRIKVSPAQQPSLAEMTEKAIRLLSRSPNGYFLFVEGTLYMHPARFVLFIRLYL